MKQHALSAAFPAMLPADFNAMVADIAANGQRDVIEVFEGAVLDGWHRERACTQLGIGPQRREFVGDPASFVLSRNLHRRHMTASQRAMAVAACAQWLPEGRPGNYAAAAQFPAGKSISALAEDAGVSPRTMTNAARVAKKAAPEVVAAVVAGNLTVEQAADVAGLPRVEQAAAVAVPRTARPETKPKAKPAPPPEAGAAVDALRAELAASMRELIADNDAMAKVFEADDRLVTAMADNKRLRALLKTADERINGLLFEKNEMTVEVKRLQRKIDKMKALEQSA